MYTFYYIWSAFFIFGPGAARAAPGASLSLGIGRRTLRGVSGARLTLLRHNQAALRPRDMKTLQTHTGGARESWGNYWIFRILRTEKSMQITQKIKTIFSQNRVEFFWSQKVFGCNFSKNKYFYLNPKAYEAA